MSMRGANFRFWIADFGLDLRAPATCNRKSKIQNASRSDFRKRDPLLRLVLALAVRVRDFRQGARFEEEDLRDALERRSEEHTSELQSQSNLVSRLLLEK